MVDVPVPTLRLSTHHYTDERFFEQVQYVHDRVGDAIHITGSDTSEKPGALLFSNVYALYEVEHWLGARAYLTWSEWVFKTVNHFNDGAIIPPWAKEARNRLETSSKFAFTRVRLINIAGFSSSCRSWRAYARCHAFGVVLVGSQLRPSLAGSTTSFVTSALLCVELHLQSTSGGKASCASPAPTATYRRSSEVQTSVRSCII